MLPPLKLTHRGRGFSRIEKHQEFVSFALDLHPYNHVGVFFAENHPKTALLEEPQTNIISSDFQINLLRDTK